MSNEEAIGHRTRVAPNSGVIVQASRNSSDLSIPIKLDLDQNVVGREETSVARPKPLRPLVCSSSAAGIPVTLPDVGWHPRLSNGVFNSGGLANFYNLHGLYLQQLIALQSHHRSTPDENPSSSALAHGDGAQASDTLMRHSSDSHSDHHQLHQPHYRQIISNVDGSEVGTGGAGLKSKSVREENDVCEAKLSRHMRNDERYSWIRHYSYGGSNGNSPISSSGSTNTDLNNNNERLSRSHTDLGNVTIPSCQSSSHSLDRSSMLSAPGVSQLNDCTLVPQKSDRACADEETDPLVCAICQDKSSGLHYGRILSLFRTGRTLCN